MIAQSSPKLVRAEVARMVAGTAGDSITLIVTEARGGSGALVAVVKLACDRESGAGEVGVVVMDNLQAATLAGASRWC